MNSIVFYILFYLSIGLFWAKILESICIKYDILGGRSFDYYEILVAILIWPVSLGVFVGSILVNYFSGGQNGEE